LLPELFEEGVDVVANVISLSLSVRHHRISVFSSLADGAGARVSPNRVARLFRCTLNLVRNPAAGIRPTLGSEDHPEREAHGSARDGTPNPDLRRLSL